MRLLELGMIPLEQNDEMNNLDKLKLKGRNKIAFETTSKDIMQRIHDMLFDHGFSYSYPSSGDRWRPTTLCNNTVNAIINDIGWNNKLTLLHGTDTNNNPLTISFNHIAVLKEWLRVNDIKATTPAPLPTPSPSPSTQPPTEQQHMPTPQPPQQQPPPSNMQTPYDLMMNDLANKVRAQLEHSSVNEARVKELVTLELATQKRVLITVENKRMQPPTTTEITEPAHEKLPELIGIIGADCWPALVGPTGSGKTLGVMQCAKVLGINIVCIKQMTRMIAPHDLVGYMDAHGNYKKGAWTDAILGGHYKDGDNIALNHVPALIIVDEMDNANENIIMIIKALQTGFIAMPYGMQEVNRELRVVATMNTWGQGATREYVGRMAQDAALLNEFQFIDWAYDTAFEWELLQRTFAQYHTEGDAEWKITHMRQLMYMFIAMRNKAETQKVRVIISTRNIIAVAKLLLCNKGWSIQQCLKMSVFKGLKEEEVKRIECPEHWTAPRRTQQPVTKQVATKQVVDLETGNVTEEECPI